MLIWGDWTVCELGVLGEKLELWNQNNKENVLWWVLGGEGEVAMESVDTFLTLPTLPCQNARQCKPFSRPHPPVRVQAQLKPFFCTATRWRMFLTPPLPCRMQALSKPFLHIAAQRDTFLTAPLSPVKMRDHSLRNGHEVHPSHAPHPETHAHL